MKRYVLQAEKSEIEEHFEISPDSELNIENNFNIKPQNTVPIIIERDEGRQIVEAKWGLSSQKKGNEVYSISKEGLLKDDSLKKMAQSSPCIIPASGFYKWKETVRDPLPFYIRVLSKEILAWAGFYTSEKDKQGQIRYRFVVLTMPANALVEPLEKTMPCILEEHEYSKWLGGEAEKMLEKGFSGAYLLPEMAVYRVPDLVNDPANNFRELIQPIPKLREDDD